MYYKPTLFRADVRKIAHGLIIPTIRYIDHFMCCMARLVLTSELLLYKQPESLMLCLRTQCSIAWVWLDDLFQYPLQLSGWYCQLSYRYIMGTSVHWPEGPMDWSAHDVTVLLHVHVHVPRTSVIIITVSTALSGFMYTLPTTATEWIQMSSGNKFSINS